MPTKQELFTDLESKAKAYALAEARRQYWQQKHDKHFAERTSLMGEEREQARDNWLSTKDPLADAQFASRHECGEVVRAAKLCADAAAADPEALNALMDPAAYDALMNP